VSKTAAPSTRRATPAHPRRGGTARRAANSSLFRRPLHGTCPSLPLSLPVVLVISLGLSVAAGTAGSGCTLDQTVESPCPVTPLGRFGGCPSGIPDSADAPATGDPDDDADSPDAAPDSADAPFDPRDDVPGDHGPDLPPDSGPDADTPDAPLDTSDIGTLDLVDPPDAGDDGTGDAHEEPDAGGPCPADMALVGATCMDLYEAPNVARGLPLVMYTYYEAQAWCEARGKRLCYDTEWTTACEGAAGTAYPYGATRVAGWCNDEETWRLYDQTLLNRWPARAASPEIGSLAELLAAVRATGSSGATAADHVEWLYQGEGAGENAQCVNEHGVYDLTGNVEEWTTRADGGAGPDFSGNLKGRYWAEARTCQSNVRSHGNAFRFYEIGFRCCRDAEPE
jgi:hypothetical protein